MSTSKKNKKYSEAVLAGIDNTKDKLIEYVLQLSEGVNNGRKHFSREKFMGQLQAQESQDELLNIIKHNLPSREVKARKPRDPNAPKRATTAFMYFCKEKRESFKKTNPNTTVGALAKIMGAAWKAMDNNAKKRWEDMAEDDRKRHATEKEKYEKNKLNMNGPKKPKSSFLFFCADKRAEVVKDNPDMSTADIQKELGRLWKQIRAGSDEKRKYERMNSDAYQKYHEALRAWAVTRQSEDKNSDEPAESTAESTDGADPVEDIKDSSPDPVNTPVNNPVNNPVDNSHKDRKAKKPKNKEKSPQAKPTHKKSKKDNKPEQAVNNNADNTDNIVDDPVEPPVQPSSTSEDNNSEHGSSSSSSEDNNISTGLHKYISKHREKYASHPDCRGDIAKATRMAVQEWQKLSAAEKQKYY